MTALPKVHLEIEQLFAAEETMPTNERALAFIRAALGEEVADMVVAGHIVEYSLSLIHISSPRDQRGSRMPSSA